MIVSSSESSICQGGKLSVTWVTSSFGSSVLWGDVDFCIRRMAYTGLYRKKTFQQGKALETTWLGSFIVEMLLLAWCHLVFISPKDWLPLTLQLIRTEWTGQLSTGEIYVRFLCRFCFSKKIQQWFLKYMVSLASHSGQAFHLSLNWNFLYQ